MKKSFFRLERAFSAVLLIAFVSVFTISCSDDEMAAPKPDKTIVELAQATP